MDNYFSRLHFMVEVNPPFCRLTDLQSTNGTLVNDRRVDQADLGDGDTIQGGKTRILVRVNDDARATRQQVRPPDTSAPERSADTDGAVVPAAPAFLQHPGPYELIREIGSGGMGIVYLARRSEDRELVALKTIRPDLEASRRDIELFLREAKILRSLDHARIIRFIEVGEASGQLYFAMDYFPAPNAAELVQEHGRLPARLAVSIAVQVLEALEYAHERGYIHRDIKPANILVAASSQMTDVRLADFGLARVYQTSRMSGITLQGDVGGSLAFAPPEHLTDYRNATPAGDLYSVGATLYTLLSGELIYDLPDTIARAVLTILQSDPVPLLSRRPDLPAALAAIVDQSLQRNPADRFESATAMRSALQRLIRKRPAH